MFSIPCEIKEGISKTGSHYNYLRIIIDEKENIDTRVFLGNAELKLLRDNYMKTVPNIKISNSTQDKD